jgi:hypothetical protein
MSDEKAFSGVLGSGADWQVLWIGALTLIDYGTNLRIALSG